MANLFLTKLITLRRGARYDWRLLDAFGCEVGRGRAKSRDACKKDSEKARRAFREKAKRAEVLMDANRATSGRFTAA